MIIDCLFIIHVGVFEYMLKKGVASRLAGRAFTIMENKVKIPRRYKKFLEFLLACHFVIRKVNNGDANGMASTSGLNVF